MPKKNAPTSFALERGRGKRRLIYRQVADRLLRDIKDGRLKPGEMLPSMDDLARQGQGCKFPDGNRDSSASLGTAVTSPLPVREARMIGLWNDFKPSRI